MPRSEQLSKRDRDFARAVLQALQQHGCISSYRINGESVHPDWKEQGFSTAFDELKTNPHPFGLKKKGERAWLYLLLAEKDKATINEWELNKFKQKYDL